MESSGSEALTVILVAIYFAPTLVAVGRKHRQAGAIFALDLLLGWTLIGWVAALVWSLTKAATAVAVAPIDLADSKICPECAETVKAAANVCRYCGHKFDPKLTNGPDHEVIPDSHLTVLRKTPNVRGPD